MIIRRVRRSGILRLRSGSCAAKTGGCLRDPGVTVGVQTPGPGELLQHYGTEEQKDHYLPRLACGGNSVLRAAPKRFDAGAILIRRGLHGRVAGPAGAGHAPDLEQTLYHPRAYRYGAGPGL
ncbi:MAG: acyl-CoA dehydrogenase family protein [Enterobacter hormaechei]